MKKFLLLLFFFVGVLVFSASDNELFNEAEGYYRAGNYALALDSYDELVRRFPLSDRVPDAQYRRGVSLFRLGRFREAVEVFEAVEQRYRSTRYFHYSYFWRGVSLYRLGDNPGAIEALRTFLAGPRDEELSPQAWLYQAQAQLAQKDYRSASHSLEELRGAFPGSESARAGTVLLLYSYLREGRIPEAVELAGSTDAQSLPENRRQLFRLYSAEAYWRDGRTAEAEPLYAGLLDGPPEVAAVAYRRLFIAAAERGQLDRMETLIREAEGRFSNQPAALEDMWVQVGVESFRQGKYDLAEYFLNKVWSLPERTRLSQTVPLYLAEVRIRKGNPAAAQSLLEEYLALKPAQTERVELRLGDVRLLQSNFAGAAQVYQEFLKHYPDSALVGEASYLLAYCRYRLGDLPGAYELAAKLLEGTLTDAQSALRLEVYKLLIAVDKKRGNTQAAVARLREYANLAPSDLRARTDLLKQLFRLKDYAGIASEAGRLLQEFPDLKERDLYAYVLSQYLRGLAEIGRKRYRNAVEALGSFTLEQAETAGLAAVVPYTLYYQGWAYYRSGDNATARERALRLMESYPAHALFPQALFLAGWTSFSLGDYKGAAAYFARLAKMNVPDADKAAFLQGRSLVNLKDLNEASAVFKSLYTTRPTSEYADDALFEYAGVLAELGSRNEALAAYDELIRKYPSSPLAEEAQYKRGEMYAAAGQPQQARDAFYLYRTRYPNGRLVDASLYWGGMAAQELGEKFGAVLHWERLIENYPASPFRPDALRRTAEAYAGRGDYAKALEDYGVLMRDYPQEAAAYGISQKMEELRLQQKGMSDREAALSVVIGREGGAESARGREAMVELSRLYIFEDSGRLDLALQMLQAVVAKAEPVTASQAQYLIGEYYYRKGDTVRAAQEFLKAAYMNPKDSDTTASSLYRAAEMMSLAGSPRDVQELVGRLEQHFPDSEWTVRARKLLEGANR
jgi:TolA-binding protein